jgi:hypothetical protein
MPQQVQVEKQKSDETKSDGGNDPLELSFRHFGALLGAVGLLSLLKDAMEWQHNLALYLDAFRAFTRPIAGFLFGWIPAMFHLSLTGAAKDFLTVGLIVSSAYLRTAAHHDKNALRSVETLKYTALAFLIWPILVITMGIVVPLMALRGFDDTGKAQSLRAARVFMSVFIYAAILIILNFVLLIPHSA